jgi:hypothetical protein
MRNKYPGVCYRCGTRVEVGAGHFERVPRKGWRTQHAECAVLWRGQKDVDQAEARARLAEKRTEAEILRAVSEEMKKGGGA